MIDVTVKDKHVTVYDSFRGREWWPLPGLYRRAWKGAFQGDYAQCVPFLMQVIVSWEFEGDPADEGAYEWLDVLSELQPLADRVLIVVSEAAFPASEPGA